MRNVVVYELLSLDGVAEQPEDFILDFDEVMEENLGRVIASQDAVLLGRHTYDHWGRPASRCARRRLLRRRAAVTAVEIALRWASVRECHQSADATGRRSPTSAFPVASSTSESSEVLFPEATSSREAALESCLA